ncbi:hypothetical protein ABPG74_012077 [Tetrahymena malaccensis]
MIFLNRNNYISKWQANEYAIYIQPASLVLNLTILIYLGTCYFDFAIFGYKKMIQPAIQRRFLPNESIQIDEEEFLAKLNKRMYSKIYQIMSIYISLYEFILSTAILYYSLMQIQNPLAPINLFLALLLGTLIIETDYDYSIDSQDFMARPYNSFNSVIYYLDLLVITLISFINKVDTLLLSIYFLTNGWFCSKICTFYHSKTRFWNIFTYFYFGTLCLTYFISFQAFSSISLPSLATIIYIPLFYKISQLICNLQDKSSGSLLWKIFDENNDISLKDVDRGIRQAFFQDLQNQRINDQLKIQIFNLIIKQKQILQANQNNKMQTQSNNNYISLKTLVKQMKSTLNIDELVLKFLKEQIMEKGVQQKIEFISYLKKKTLDANVLVNQAKQLRIIQQKIKNSINELSMINSENLDLISLQVFYLQTLSFEEKDLIQDKESFIVQNNNFSKFNYSKMKQCDSKKMHNSQIRNKFYINDLFKDTNSCVLFTKVEDGFNLSIQKVSKNFYKIFGISQQDVKNQRIEILIPQQTPLIKKHNEYIASYFQNQNDDTIQMKNKIIFFKSSKDYLIPVKTDIRLNYSYHLNEIGFTSFIQQVKDNYQYILFYIDTLNVVGITQHLQQNIFSNYNINLSQVKDLGKYFPFLYKLVIQNKQQAAIQEPLQKEESDTKQFNSMQDILSFSREKQVQVTYIQERHINKYTINNVEYLLIIQNGNQQAIQLQEDFELSQFSYFLMDISIQECGYKDLQNLYFLKVSKMLNINPNQHGHIIFKHLKQYPELYQQIISQNALERIQKTLQNRHQILSSLSFQSNSDLQRIKLNKQNEECNQNLKKLTCQSYLQIFRNIEENSEPSTNLVLLEQKSQKQGIQNSQQIEQISTFQFTPRETQSQISKRQEGFTQECIKGDSKQHIKSYDYSPTQTLNRNRIDQRQLIDLNQKQQINLDKQITLNNKNSICKLSPTNYQSQVNNFTCSVDKKEVEKQQHTDFNQNQQFMSMNSIEDQLFFSHRTNQNLISPINQDILQKTNQTLKILQNNKSQLNNKIQKQYSLSSYQNIGIKQIQSESNIQSLIQGSSQQKFYQCQENLDQDIFNEKSILKSKNKFSTKKDKKQDKIREQNIDQSSSSISRDSASSSQKKNLIDIIRRNSDFSANRVVNVFGMATFLTLTIITTYQYFSFMDSLDQMNQIMNSQNWPYEVQNLISKQIRELNFLQLERQNNFPFASQEAQKKFDATLLDKISQNSEEFINILLTMDQQLSSQILQNQISNQQSQFYVNIDYDTLNTSGVPSKNKSSFFEVKNSSLWYSILVNNYYIYQISENAFGQLQEMCLLQNINNLQTGMQGTVAYFQDYQNQQVLGVKNQLSLLIGVIMIISAVCLLSIIPLYYLVSRKKQTILNLFSTFTVYELQSIILKIKYFYNKYSIIQSNLKNTDCDNQKFSSKLFLDCQNNKKQTLSHITKLPKYKLSLILIIFLLYLLLSLYPILNKIFIEIYLDNQSNNFMILDNLNSARQFVQQSSSFISLGIVMKIYPKSKLILLSDYISQIRLLMKNTDEMLINVTKISNQFNLIGRHQQSQFDKFFFPMFENDICTLIEKNYDLVQNSISFEPDSCRKIQNGFLQQGLKLSLKKFTSILIDQYNIIEINEDDQLFQAKQNLFLSLSLEDFLNFIDYLDKVFIIMNYFIVNNIFGLGWYLFSFWIADQITKFKQYLQVINIQNLLDNKYVLIFIKNNTKL